MNVRQTDRKRAVFALILACTVLAAAWFSLWVRAAQPDRPENGYVLDAAGVLSDATERLIVEENQQLFADTGAEIVVAAVDFLGGEAIDDYTYELFNAWGVGSSQRNNGLLLVLAVGEDDYYAQAGYGIEDYFDGAKLKSLLNDYLEDDFAAGDYDAGVRKFFTAALSEMESYYRSYEDPSPAEDELFSDPEPSGPSLLGSLFRFVAALCVIVLVVLVFFVLIRVLFSGGGGGPRSGGGGGGFWSGMFWGSMLSSRRRTRWVAPPPPPPPGPGVWGPGGFSRPRGVPRPTRRPPSGGFSHGGGFTRGGGASRGGFGGSGGFSRGGGSRGGGAGRH